uniref:Lipoprotein n=1 Tax=Prevotella sp. GTC17253 TaxID=3236793 RepID=A0AB33IX06_9BACT
MIKRISFLAYIAILICISSCNTKKERQKDLDNTLYCTITSIFISPQDSTGKYNLMLEIKIKNPTSDTIFLPERKAIAFHGIPFFYRSFIDAKLMNKRIPLFISTSFGNKVYMGPHWDSLRLLSYDNFTIDGDRKLNMDSLRNIKLIYRYEGLSGYKMLKRIKFEYQSPAVFILPAGLNRFSAYRELCRKRLQWADGTPVSY